MKSRADRRRSCNDESLMPKSVAQQRVSKHGPPRPSRRRAEEARLPGSSPGQALRMRRREISIIQKAPQLPRPTRMLQLPQRFRLDLPDTLSRHRELLADFFERVVGVHADAEAQRIPCDFPICPDHAMRKRRVADAFRPLLGNKPLATDASACRMPSLASVDLTAHQRDGALIDLGGIPGLNGREVSLSRLVSCAQ